MASCLLRALTHLSWRDFPRVCCALDNDVFSCPMSRCLLTATLSVPESGARGHGLMP